MLTALVGDAQAEAFGSGWPCKPLAHHGPLGRVPPLAALAKVDRDALATRPCARRMLLDRDDDGWIVDLVLGDVWRCLLARCIGLPAPLRRDA